MTSIKFKIIPLQECFDIIYKNIDISQIINSFLNKENILVNTDIFTKNERAKKQKYTRFDLFEITETNPDFYVSSLYLETFEHVHNGHMIPKYIELLCNIYHNKIVIFQWNHDNDFTRYHDHIKHIKNFKIINFGYNSVKHEYDIVVPFWAINTNFINEEKKYFCSFVGSLNNVYRQHLKDQIEKTQDIRYFRAGKSEDVYLRYLSKSIFSLCPLGGPNDGGFSYRFFECFHVNTVPVLLVDNLIFPYPELNWDDLCVRVPQATINNIEEFKNILKISDVDKILSNINVHRNKFTLGGVQEEIIKNLL